MRARALVLLATFAVLLPMLAAGPAHAGTSAVTIVASDQTTPYGGDVTLTVTVEGDPACLDGRTVILEWRPADSSGSAIVGQGTTDDSGTVSLDQSQQHTGRYRASVSSSGGCTAATSELALVRVRASVDGSVVAGDAEAGSCVDAFVSVTPSKTGQLVELQRRTKDGWDVLESLTLDAHSSATASPCLGFDDIGVVRYRFRWTAQDELNETATTPMLAFEVTPAAWMESIEDAIGGRAISVAVGEEDVYLYRRADLTARTPASNEKLLLAMAMFDTFGADFEVQTRASARTVRDGVVRGDLWILGRGDPRVGRASMGALAQRIVDAGIARIAGDVRGSTTYFRRDWDAPGWNNVARDYVNRPTALTFDGNDSPDPERRAAEALTERLEELGVRVGGKPGSGRSPDGLTSVASVSSQPLATLLRKTLVPSNNFSAEVLGKRLGAEVRGAPGTIAKGAATVEDWVNERGAGFELFDNSGLSYANRVSARGMVELLWHAEDAPWGVDLRRALPTGGQGTLRDRLHNVQIRAKTGTLTDVSALSGWVYADRLDAWVEFSILCSGLSKSTASGIEDEIVRVLAGQLG